MSRNQSTSARELFLRLSWMMVGPLILAILAYNIIHAAGGWLTPADIAYFVLLALIGLARWLEFRTGNPRTADGEPAGPGHLRRYLIGLFVIGLIVWAAANVIGNYVLAS